MHRGKRQATYDIKALKDENVKEEYSRKISEKTNKHTATVATTNESFKSTYSYNENGS